MKSIVYTFFTLISLVECGLEKNEDIASPPSNSKNQENEVDETTRDHVPEKSNDSTAQTEDQPDYHNLAVFDYIQKFNRSEVQDQDEIDKYLANEHYTKIYDDSLGPRHNEIHTEGSVGRSTHDIELQNKLNSEFMEHYRQNEGRWARVVGLEPEQRIELCKDAYRCEHEVKKVIFYEAAIELRTSKIQIEGLGPVTPDLLKCTINLSISGNGILFPKKEIFYLAEGNTPDEVFKLLTLKNEDEVRVGKKLSPIKYPSQ